MKHTNAKISLLFFVILTVVFFMQCGEPLKNNEIPITSNSEEAINLFLEGRELLENLKTPQAAELFDRAIALDSNFAHAYYYRANSGGGYKAFRENLAKASDLIDKVSDGEKYLILYGVANADGDGIKQKSELDGLLKLYPDDKRVQDIAGGYYYYNVQNYAKSLEHFNNAVNLDSNFAPSYNGLGYLYDDMGNYVDAEKSYKKYVTLIPDEANPYDSYAEFLLKRGRHTESITQYEKAYNVDPEFVMAFSGIGDNYIFMEEFDKAREYYQKYYDEALNINQKMGALYLKAISFVYEDKIDKTLATFEERIKLAKTKESPNYVLFSYLNTGWLLDEIGKFKEAKNHYEKAGNFIKNAELNDADRISYQLYLDLNLCLHDLLKGDLDKAESGLTVCNDAIEKRGNPYEKQFLNLVMGMLETEKENYQKASKHFTVADRESPYTWYREAIALEKSGKKTEAKKTYDKVANCNDNGMDLAIVRNQAKEKLTNL
ncbi:MAG: tetratricopeptide repeat protein [Bacteroidota bacterium]